MGEKLKVKSKLFKHYVPAEMCLFYPDPFNEYLPAACTLPIILA